jgi:phenylacetate-CoA ligase
MGIVNRIIKKQPSIIKQLYYNIIPFKYRYSTTFNETCSFLEKVDTWRYDEAIEYQLDELRKIINFSYNNVPYYHKLFIDYGINPNIHSFDDVKKIPILNKEIILNNFNDLISTNYNGKKILFKTSGSTGKRLEFYGDDVMFKKEASYIYHSFKSHGSNLYNDWTIWIRRHSPKDNSDLIVKDYELKRIYMSPFHLNDSTILYYVNMINDSKSNTIVTYPSTAYWLSCLLEKHNLKLPNITSIHGASEKCIDDWGEKIKKVFGFSLKMHYGQVEKVSFMYQSTNSEYYHNDLTYSYTEFDESNTIIGTSFMNYVMPFIRYKTNDIVTLNPNVIKDSSRPLSVISIDGRVDDMIVSESGSRIPAVNFYTVMSKIESVDMFQIYQKKDKSLKIKLTVNSNFNSSILNKLKHEIINRVGELSIDFEIVGEISRDLKTGKLRCVITELK